MSLNPFRIDIDEIREHVRRDADEWVKNSTTVEFHVPLWAHHGPEHVIIERCGDAPGWRIVNGKQIATWEWPHAVMTI